MERPAEASPAAGLVRVRRWRWHGRCSAWGMTKPDALDLDDNTDDGAPVPWLAMPDRSDDAAVEAWFEAMAKAEAELAAESARTLDACIELFEEIADLAGVALTKPAEVC